MNIWSSMRAATSETGPLDRTLFVAAALLSVVSLIALRSAAATLNPSLVWKQAMWIGLGIGASLLTASIPYTRLVDASIWLYAATMALLGLVEFTGTVKLGAARWLTIGGLSLQPSELAKLATACCLARFFSDHPSPLSLRSVVGSVFVAGLPTLLVFLEPDLGSASIILAIWLGMAWVAGLEKRDLLAMGLIGLLALPIGWFLLKEYQRTRLTMFINPHADPLGAGYTIIQSQIAVGSGQWFGRGWMAGTQSQLNFLPERHADFLYSVIGEEWGFFGSIFVVALFGMLLWRGIHIALQQTELQGRLLSVGLVTWIAYQSVINMGMVMGIVPVVGVPLPLVSYGGSAMVTTWVAVGLLESVHRFGTRF